MFNTDKLDIVFESKSKCETFSTDDPCVANITATSPSPCSPSSSVTKHDSCSSVSKRESSDSEEIFKPLVADYKTVLKKYNIKFAVNLKKTRSM